MNIELYTFDRRHAVTLLHTFHLRRHNTTHRFHFIATVAQVATLWPVEHASDAIRVWVRVADLR